MNNTIIGTKIAELRKATWGKAGRVGRSFRM